MEDLDTARSPRDFVPAPRRPDGFTARVAEGDESVDVGGVGNVDLVRSRFGLGVVVVPPPTSPGS